MQQIQAIENIKMLSKMLGFFKKLDEKRLMPESLFNVSFDKTLIIVKRPDGKEEKVKWDDLQAIIIETTDDGPISPDVFWILAGSNKTGCLFPGGSTGEKEILNEMQSRLKDFDNEVLIKAMCSCDNEKFLIWKSE